MMHRMEALRVDFNARIGALSTSLNERLNRIDANVDNLNQRTQALENPHKAVAVLVPPVLPPQHETANSILPPAL
jgi:hypothetical protein